MGCTERPSHRGYETVLQSCAELYMGYIDHSPDCAGLYMGHIDRPATLHSPRYGAYRPLPTLNFVVAHLPAAPFTKIRSQNRVPNAR